MPIKYFKSVQLTVLVLFAAVIMIKLIFLLLFLIWNVGGVKRVMPDIDVHPSNSTEDDFSGSGSDEDEIPCCNIGNYTFYSIVDVLNNVTTSNTIINISTDVVLSSIVTLEGLNNITIIGQGNPTVNCNDIGSVKFVSCNNVTIEGVNWERCGFDNAPGIKFYNSSNIVLQSSSFQHSVGQAVVLSNMSGNVYINNCQFTYNKYHKGNGTAIYYISSPEQSTHVQLVINNCNFTFNGPAESVVYIDNSNNKVNGHISLLQNSTFTQNKGVPIYISHTSLILNNSVSFKDNKATAGGGIYSSNSIIKFDDKCNVSFDNNLVSTNGGAIYQEANSNMFFTMNAIAKFTRNSAIRYGSAIFTKGRSLISFEDQSQATFDDNRARSGGAVFVSRSTIWINGSSKVKFNNNNGEFGGAVSVWDNSVMSFEQNSTIIFTGNRASVGGGATFSNITQNGESTLVRTDGGAIWSHNSSVSFYGHCTVTFNNNFATHNGGALHSGQNSSISFCGNSVVDFNHNKAVKSSGGAVDFRLTSYVLIYDNAIISFHNNTARWGGAIGVFGSSNISFDGNSRVKFTVNKATNRGGAVHQHDNCRLSFGGNSVLKFSDNSAEHGGGAIDSYPNGNCYTTFHGNSTLSFHNNRAKYGGVILSDDTSKMSFTDNVTITFTNNRAIYGGALDADNCVVSFTGHIMVTFTNNTGVDRGGALFCTYNCHMTFNGNSTLTFNNNNARNGGAMMSDTRSRISFDESTMVTFNGNVATNSGGAVYGGGAIDSYSGGNCYTKFHGNSTLSFHNNRAWYGGAIISDHTCNISFTDDVTVTFNNNRATYGGVLFASTSDVSFTGHSMMTFTNNTGVDRGGALYCTNNCHMMFNGNSTLTFNNNNAMNGGAMISYNSSRISFDESTAVIFNGNVATDRGGAVYGGGDTSQFFGGNCYTTFHGNSTVSFHNNRARYGGAIHSDVTSNVSFNHNVTITFTNNTATSGGALNTDNSNVLFTGNSHVIFRYNTAVLTGGALSCTKSSYLIFHGNSTVSFKNNKAVDSSGGAVASSSYSHMLLHGNTSITFDHNIAGDGGAVSIVQSNMSISTHSLTIFINNTAKGHGGAIYLSDNFTATFIDGSDIMFSYNTATGYGGAIYGKLSGAFQNKVILNTTAIHFYNNTALVGEDIYVHIPSSCDDLCINNSIVGNAYFSLFGKHIISTPRSKLVLGYPAVYIDEDNDTNCGKYYINNIMLGQEIIINACVQDYYDQPADATRFLVSSNSQDYHIIGASTGILISCNNIKEIGIIGYEVTTPSNISMTLTSHHGSQTDLKTISIELIIELSPCHPGFYYDNTTQWCICYYDDDIITCSDSTSFIRRGYWFGVVNDKSTVTVCPNNYCDFPCCEATNGFYKLSPVRMNQCSSHRSGTACGSCEEGYTLSFDSVECVSVDKCSAGQTVMVVTLSVIYWIVIVILVFIMTYYHVGIGYLYAITYYYSMLDILLSQNLYQSKGLFTTVTTLSSLVKITPRFLGQLCLVKYMSGIDQQFIHYTHLLAVLVIIAIICQSARISHKFASFIGRSIIRTICFLVLMSYTSVTTTSLLLLRSLTFDNVDKVYTYLSPDIEYFRGRHLPYFIVAVLCTLVIVIGLPLLLLLEPFLNHKINFTRIKPLLDQFQGCYKDKYRSFAAFYMICRFVITMIIIVTPSTDILFLHLLIFSSAILAFILISVLRPYDHKILNIFDGLILLLVVLPTLIPLVSQQLSTATIIIVMILPLIFFITLELIVHKEAIKTITTKIAAHFKTEPVSTTNDNNEVPMGDIGIIIDDNMRKNATICEM